MWDIEKNTLLPPSIIDIEADWPTPTNIVSYSNFTAVQSCHLQSIANATLSVNDFYAMEVPTGPEQPDYSIWNMGKLLLFTFNFIYVSVAGSVEYPSDPARWPLCVLVHMYKLHPKEERRRSGCPPHKEEEDCRPQEAERRRWMVRSPLIL